MKEKQIGSSYIYRNNTIWPTLICPRTQSCFNIRKSINVIQCIYWVLWWFAEAEKASNKTQHPVKINISKRPKKSTILFNGETFNISFWDCGRTRTPLLFLFNIKPEVLGRAVRHKKNEKEKDEKEAKFSFLIDDISVYRKCKWFIGY